MSSEDEDMEFYEEEQDAMSDDNFSQTDWNQEDDCNQDLSINESAYGEEAWHEDGYSDSNFGDEPRGGELQPEPPDYDRDDRSNVEEAYHEGDSWCEETESDISLGEREHEAEVEYGEFGHEDESFHEEAQDQNEELYGQRESCYEETKSHNFDGKESCDEEPWDDEAAPRNSYDSEPECDELEYGGESYYREEAEAEDSLGGEQGLALFISKTQEPSHDERDGYEPHNLSFSGLDQDPEAYLRWERGLEDWFWYYKVPKEKRLSHAINALVGEAYTWWVQEEALNYYRNPVTTWGVLKQRMYREFVQKPYNSNYIPKRLMIRTSSRGWMPTPKKACCHETKKVSPKTQEKRTTSTQVEPAKHDHQLPKPKEGVQKTSPKPLVKLKGKDIQGVIVSRSKLFQEGEHDEDIKSSSTKDQGMCSTYKISLKLTCYKCKNRGHIAKDCPSKKEKIKAILREDTSRQLVQQITKQVEIHPEVCEPREHITPISSDQEELSQEALKKDKELKTTHSLDTQTTSEKEGNQVTSKPYSTFCENSCFNACLIHLSSSKSIEKISGTITFQEEASTMEKTFVDRNHTMEKLDQKPTQGDSKHLQIKSTNQQSGRGVIMSLLIKEEPPDAPLRPQPSDMQTKNRGNLLNTQIIRVTNLNSLCADPTILRTKCSQGGGNDVVIRPVAEPELHQTYHTSRIELNKDTCASLGAYGMSQDDSDHETTWRTSSGHLGFTSKKNKVKRISYEEDIEDTSWQIFNEPAGDMCPLIKLFRPNDDESRNKTRCSGNLTHHRTRENWIHIDIGSDEKDITFLNQMILDLPYLEPSEFKRRQSFIWRPGGYLLQLETSIDTSRCIQSHWIRRIQSFPLIHQHFPYPAIRAFILGSINPQRLFSDLWPLKSISRRLVNHGYVQKLSRYKPLRISPFGASIQASNSYIIKPTSLIYLLLSLIC